MNADNEASAEFCTVSLPENDPKQAARILMHVCGEEYARRLLAELERIYQNPKEA